MQLSMLVVGLVQLSIVLVVDLIVSSLLKVLVQLNIVRSSRSAKHDLKVHNVVEDSKKKKKE